MRIPFLTIAILLPLATAQANNGASQAPEGNGPPVAQAPAEDHPYRALLERSPFLTRAWLEQQRRARSRGSAQLTFHGYFRSADDNWVFSVLNQREQASYWVTLGDTIDNARITAFDPQSQLLTITSEGTTIQLPLSRQEN